MGSSDGINKWQAEKLEFGQLIWTVENDGEGRVELRELAFVAADEHCVLALRRPYGAGKSVAGYRFGDIHDDRDQAHARARSEQGWEIISLEARLKKAKRTWNAWYARDDRDRKDVEEDWDD